MDKTSLIEGDTLPITATVSLSNPSTKAVVVVVAEVIPMGDTKRLTVDMGSVTVEAGQTMPAADADEITITAVDNETDDGGATAKVQATSAGASSSDSDSTEDGAQPHEITIEDDDRAPGMPRHLTVTPGNEKLTVEWTSPEDNGTTDITHYELRHALTADIGDATWERAETGKEIAGLTNGSEYTVEVRAVSAAGEGAAASATGTPTGS